MEKKARHIAAGGITAALTVALCMVGALTVAGRFFSAALCGILLLLVKRYLSGKLAVTVYAASSLLLLLLPDRLTAAAYILLFGYYPILRDALGKLPAVLRITVKLAVVTAVGCISLYVGAAVMGLWGNARFMELYPVLILIYYGMMALFDLFLLLLTRQLQSRWDDKLRRLFR